MANQGTQRHRRDQLQRIPAMDCGLYRTTVAMAGHDDHLGADQLVMLHDHRPEALPYVLFPAKNEDNRWQFGDEPHAADDAEFLMGLVSLPPEGYYVLKRRLSLSDDPDDGIAERALVMVGYNRQGHVILFPAQFRGLEVRFPPRGYRFESVDVIDALEPANFTVPDGGSERTIH
jgi:hypothetical protein